MQTEKKSSHCVFACTSMVDYSILHERVCYFLFKKNVSQMCCKLELKTLNNRKTTASLRNHRKRRVCSDPCICTTQRYSFFFQQSFARNLKNISPIVWNCGNIRHPYKISNMLYKTNEKAVSFLSTIFPRSFEIVVISDVPTRYLIFCTKQTRKQSLFYWQHPERHMTFPECIHFPGRMACLSSETPKGVL